MIENVLYNEIPLYNGQEIDEGVYYGTIKDVKPIKDDKIQVRIELILEDGTSHNVFIRTSLKPKCRYDMILRLSNVCKTRKPIEFIDTEVYVSVKINTPTPSTRYENVIDVIECDLIEERGEYEITDKGYFIR